MLHSLFRFLLAFRFFLYICTTYHAHISPGHVDWTHPARAPCCRPPSGSNLDPEWILSSLTSMITYAIFGSHLVSFMRFGCFVLALAR